MSRFNNNRGGMGMNNFQHQQRRGGGGGPGGPMRGGLMGNPHFRNHPFQNQNQNQNNRRGGQNFNRPQNQQQGPQKAIIPPPSPGPALTMKGPMQQQQTPPAKLPETPAKPAPPTPSTPATKPAVTPTSTPAPTTPAVKVEQPSPAKPVLTSPDTRNNQNVQNNQQMKSPPPPSTPNNTNGQNPGPRQQNQNPGPRQQNQSPSPRQQNQSPSPRQQNQGGPRQQNQRPQNQGSRFGPPHNSNPRSGGGPQQQGHRGGGGPSPQTTRPKVDREEPAVKSDDAGESQTKEFRATLSMLLKPGEKTYTQRCRLFIGNLPNDITEEDFKRLFAKYGEPSELFINKSKGFGFIRLESRALAEIAKAELDDIPMKGRPLRVRFATHSAALSIKNLSPFVSNELLEEAFSQFGMVERSIVIVDDRGRSTGKGIVEFASKPAARKALDRCNEGVFLLTTSPRPVVVEPLEQFDDEDGLPEKLAQKNPRYQAEREEPPRFARPGTFEYEYSKRWKSLDEMEKQQRQQVEKNMQEAREKLESEMEDAFHEHQANMLRQDLLRRQEELRRMEEVHSQEMQKRKEMQLRQEEQRRLREEEMLHKREVEEQLRLKREENYRMGNFMDRGRDMRMGGGASMGMGDMAFGASSQKFGMGQQGMGQSAGGLMGNEMRNERFAQGGRGMGPGNSAYGRVREEFDGPAKKPRF